MDGIRIEGLTKRYPRAIDLFQLLRHPFRHDQTIALRELDLELRPGEIYGFVGPNGAGKTTLLKILAGLVLPTHGRVLSGVDDLATRRARGELGIGLVVSDERSFFWRISVRENLRFFAALQDIPRAERDARIDECLTLVGLAERSADSFHSLSTGLRQRLAIARGLLGDPHVLLMDEATRSLDPGAAADIRAALKTLFAGDRERILVWATHNLAEVGDLCSRVVVIKDGRITAQRRVAAASDVDAYELRTRSAIPAELLRSLEHVEARGEGARYAVRVDRGEDLDGVIDALREARVGILALEPLQLGAEDLFELDGTPAEAGR